MHSTVFSYDDLKSSDTFRIKHYKDSLYRGELNERKREGRGVIVYENGRFYEGYWLNDKRHG